MTDPLDGEFTILDDFAPVGYEQWRASVEEALQGASFERKLVRRSYEGIAVQPVYASPDVREDDPGVPGLPPYIRGSSPAGSVISGWDLRQEHAHPDLDTAAEAIRQDVDGGVTSLLLILETAAARGWDPAGGDELVGEGGLTVFSVSDLDRLLETVDLSRVTVTLDAGNAFVPAASLLAALWDRRGLPADSVRGAFHADPLAAWVTCGSLGTTVDDAIALLADLAGWTDASFPHVTAVGVDTAPYHDAGATAAQDIGVGLATGLEYLRAMTGGGLGIDAAARQITFRMRLGTRHFMAIAKLRAARRLWSRVLDVCGGTRAGGPARIHARVGNRVLTRRDPYVNLLRNTAAVFAAGVGGADAVTSVPLDHAVGYPGPFSRRIARNTALVLQDEAHLHRVVDPAAGSWFLDNLTESLAEKAWQFFQEIEGAGGMIEAIRDGWIADQVEAAHQRRADDIACRALPITGVSEFPELQESFAADPPPDTAAIRNAAIARRSGQALDDPPRELNRGGSRLAEAAAAAARGATIGQIAQALGFGANTDHSEGSVRRLALRRFAEPFEELRDASDAQERLQGSRPHAFLVNLGTPAQYSARATFARNLLVAGGFEVVEAGGFDDVEEAVAAFSASTSRIAVLCSSDKLYPEHVPVIAPRLKEAGASTVVLAGHPRENRDAWVEAGVDHFVFLKCDALGVLRDLLRQVGALEGEAG